mmetsp:Transcript_9345/g.17281  ORF Transcript_9345/g.17281 Transcript_9345/m.17281 type:complete len:210 (-) Transcript_9345:121-750(-)
MEDSIKLGEITLPAVSPCQNSLEGGSANMDGLQGLGVYFNHGNISIVLLRCRESGTVPDKVVVNDSIVIPASHKVVVLQGNHHRVVPHLIFGTLRDDHTAHRHVNASIESQNIVIDELLALNGREVLRDAFGPRKFLDYHHPLVMGHVISQQGLEPLGIALIADPGGHHERKDGGREKGEQELHCNNNRALEYFNRRHGNFRFSPVVMV